MYSHIDWHFKLKCLFIFDIILFYNIVINIRIESLAISLLFAMLSSVLQKDDMLCEGTKVFEFMIDHLIDDIFD